MRENKTRPNSENVDAYLAGIRDERRREDCKALVAIMGKATKQKPTMWGTAIVGFGVHRYKYSSGGEGEICLVGFSSRKGDISIYGIDSAPQKQDLLPRLGKHKMGKSCLYVSKLDDVDLTVLEQLISASVDAKTG